MKKTIKLLGFIVFVAVIVFALATCSGKKEGGGNSGNGASSSRSSAKEAPASDFAYLLTEDGRGVRITDYTGESETVVIPSKIEDMPVLEICGRVKTIYSSGLITYLPVFWGSTSIVMIPNSVEYIGPSAFSNMKSLTSITLPDGLKVIESELFDQCNNLRKVNLPASLEEIGGYAFSMCGELTELIIPDSIQKVRFTSQNQYETTRRDEPDNSAFYLCSKLPLATRSRLQQLGYKGQF